MIKHCKSTLTTQQHSFFTFLFIMTISLPLLLQQLPLFVTTLFVFHLDYFTSLNFYNLIYSSLFPSTTINQNSTVNKIDDTITQKDTVIQKSTVVKNNTKNSENTNIKKPNLSIDTTSTIITTQKNDVNNDTDNNTISTSPNSIEFTKPDVTRLIRHNQRRHYSVSSHAVPEIDFYSNRIPHLSPSASSVSSFGSMWSADDSKRSRVEEMIYLFETGGHRHLQQRRYSADSHNYYHHNNKPFIRERKFEYKPIVGEWKKRANGSFPIQLSESKSTPVRRKMPPIPEKSKSTWA